MNDAIDFILWAAGFVALAQLAVWILNYDENGVLVGNL